MFFYEHVKHIEVDCHPTCCDTYDDQIISLLHVNTQFQIAPNLTKNVCANAIIFLLAH